MRRAAALVALLMHLAQGAQAAGGVYVLTLPRATAAGEAVALQVRAGALRRGMEIDVYSERGALLGTVSPFGVRGGRDAGTYTIALPAPRGRRVAVRLALTRYGEPPRPPNSREVRSVRLMFVGVTR